MQVPAERVEQEIDDRLKSVSRNAKMKGFRPGKVPMTVIRQKFGGQVRQEVLGEIMQTSYSEAISRENLTPAGAPQIAADNLESGQDLKYTATFEVYPQIELKGLFDFSIEKPQPEITDADMDAMLENLRKQKAVWETIKRAAKEGDRVIVDFDGEIGGEAFEGGHGENVSVVIGGGQMLSDFENGLSGISTGEVREVKVKFPKDYPNEKVADKSAIFNITARSVEQLNSPKVDTGFAREYGIEDGNVEFLKDELKQNMKREMEQTVRRRMKEQILDSLVNANPLDVPRSLVDDEINQLMHEARNAGLGGEDGSTPRDAFESTATRRVALGLLIAEVVRSQNIELDRDRVKSRVEELAQGHENAEELSRAYLADPRFRGQIESMVLEEQVIDWLISQAEITEKPTTFGKLMNFGTAAVSGGN